MSDEPERQLPREFTPNLNPLQAEAVLAWAPPSDGRPSSDRLAKERDSLNSHTQVKSFEREAYPDGRIVDLVLRPGQHMNACDWHFQYEPRTPGQYKVTAFSGQINNVWMVKDLHTLDDNSICWQDLTEGHAQFHQVKSEGERFSWNMNQGDGRFMGSSDSVSVSSDKHGQLFGGTLTRHSDWRGNSYFENSHGQRYWVDTDWNKHNLRITPLTLGGFPIYPTYEFKYSD